MKNYDPQFGGEEHENTITGNEQLILTELYEEWLDMHPGILDEARTTIVWCNVRGLFNEERVKEFLNEQGRTDGPTN